MAVIEDPQAARRLARAIISDVALYNEEKIVKGLQEDNVFDTLKEELEEGRELYKSRVSPEIFQGRNFYDLAIVDVLLKPKAHVKTKIW